MIRDARRSHWASNAALAALLLAVSAVTISAMLTVLLPHASYGMRLVWRTNDFGERNLAIVSVEPGSVAARAGLRRGDEISTFASPSDRIALTLQSNLGTGWYLAPGQPVSFTIETEAGQRAVALRAAAADPHRPAWFMELRLLVYLAGALLAGAVVLLRPSAITWGFALFVILGAQPNIMLLEFAGHRGSPVLFAFALFAFVPCAVAAGFLGLIAFAARFPDAQRHPDYLTVERVAQGYVALVVLAFLEHYAGEYYGWPSLSFAALVNCLYYPPALIAIAMLLHTLQRSRGDARRRLIWAIAGPSLGTLFTLGNVVLVAVHVPYAYAAALGLVSSVSPFAMMYAIVRHRAIELGENLEKQLARAAAQAAPARAKPGRSELVRRIALLFSANVPLHDIYAQLSGLLAHFVDATSVLIVVGNVAGARLEYNFEDGAGARPDNVAIPSDSIVMRVLRTGQPMLFRRSEEWPVSNLVSVGGKETLSTESGIFVPVTFGGAIIGALSVQSLTPNAYDRDDVSMLETCAIYLSARMYDEEEATTGGSRLLDRSSFDRALEANWKAGAERNEPLSVLLVDVDLFSPFNDAYGHAAGDTCLRQVGGVVEASAARDGELAARYGEEEFALLLPNCDAARAIEIGERIRGAVRALDIAHQSSSLGSVSVSVGIATYAPNPSRASQAVIAEADAQLQRAKDAGRNRVSADGYASRAQEARRQSRAADHDGDESDEFVGRQAELERLELMLGESRVLTLAGPEGAGKTRTALALARRCAPQYADGVRVVDLRAVTSADAVAGTIAARLFPGHGLEGVDAPQLAELLRGRELLLVLDNCTPVAAGCASIAKSLVTRLPGTRVLCTTSRPLRLAEEKTYELDGMSAEDALELFGRRAKRPAGGSNGESNAAAQRLVDRIGRFPLSLELAAAEMDGQSVDVLLARVPEAANDVQAVVAWSVAHLPPQRQAMLHRLGIFPGDFSEASAAAMFASAGVSGDDAGTALAELAVKALVVRSERDGEARYSLPGGVREYAQGVLVTTGEMPHVKREFVDHFGSFADWTVARKTLLPYEAWLSLQLREADNYRAALRWAMDDLDDPSAAAKILRSLTGLLGDLALGGDLRTDLRRIVRQGELSDAVQAALQMALSEMRRSRGPAESLRAAHRAFELFVKTGDETGAAYAVWLIAAAQLREHGSIETDLELPLAEGIACAKRAGDRHLAVGLMRNLAYLQSDGGRHEEARTTLREAAALADGTDVVMLAALYANTALEEFRNGKTDAAIAMWRQAAALVEVVRPSFAALCFANVGLGELKRGNQMAARSALRKGLATLRATGHTFGIAASFDHFARLAKSSFAYERAARLAGFAQASFERGVSRPVTEQGLFDELIEEVRRSLGNASFEREWNRGRWMSLDEATAEAREV